MGIKNLAMFAASYRLRKIRLGYKPFFIWIEPTSFCNLKCVTCPQSMGRPIERGYMRLDLYKKALSEVSGFKPMMVSLHLGGEPLMHKEIAEMIRLAKTAGLEVTLASNAALLTKDKAQEIINAGLDGITVNFSADKASFEKNYKGAKWDIVYNHMREFLEIKKARGSVKPIFSIQLLVNENEAASAGKNIEELKRLFNGLPVDSIIDVKMHNWSGDYADKSGKKAWGKGTPCSHLWSSMVIRWNGDVVPCCRDLEGDMVLGNINNEPLSEVWNNRNSVDMRKKHKEGRFKEIPICRNCSKLWEGTTLGSLVARQISKLPLMIGARLSRK
ncbi:MAG: SPASM domain-containing protein [Deltaproteobacteria bacterium]|nr:SPASM domain-containing protein [Deltaproteobacteria bacterium]